MRWYKEKTFETGPAGVKKETGDAVKVETDAAGDAIKVETAAESDDLATGKVVWVKKFKGSILVVFKNVELAEKCLKDKDLVFKGNTIVCGILIYFVNFKLICTKFF